MKIQFINPFFEGVLLHEITAVSCSVHLRGSFKKYTGTKYGENKFRSFLLQSQWPGQKIHRFAGVQI